MTRSTPILWADVVNDQARCDEQGREVMQLASEYGICDGITCPGTAPTVMSACSLYYQYASHPTAMALCSALYQLALMHIFEAVARVCLAGLSPHDALSLRAGGVSLGGGRQAGERYCPDPGITPRTVTFHLNNVVSKLGASSKSQAISWALKQGMVRLNVEMALVANVDENQ